MKKVVYLLVALVAFVFGISVFYARLYYFRVSLSELRRNTSQLQYFEIKVVGKLEVTYAEGRYFVNLKDWEDPDCRDNLCFRGLELSREVEEENISLIREVADKNITHRESGLPDGEYIADVEVRGRLVEKAEKFFGGTFHDIRVREIKQLSPVRFVPLHEIMQR